MAFLGNLRVTTIAYLGNGALAGLGVTCAAAALFATGKIGERLIYADENTVPSLIALDDISSAMGSARLSAAKLLLARDDATRRAFATRLDEQRALVARELAGYAPLISDSTERSQFETVNATWRDWQNVAEQVSKTAATNRDAAIALFDTRLNAIGPRLEQAIRTEKLYNKDISTRATDAAKALIAQSSTLSLALIFVSIAVAVAVVALFLHRVVRPLSRLNAAMGDMAAGDLDREVPGLDLTDEVGDIGRALLAIKQAAAERSRHEADGRMAMQQQVVTELGQGLAALKIGQLGARIDHPFPGDYEQLRVDFNEATRIMAALMHQVTAAAQSVRVGAGEISAAASDLAVRTESQAASLEESAAAVRELTASVTSASQTALEAAALARTAQGNASTSGEVMAKAVGAMTQIALSSQRMGEIVGLIEGIAFQTNLLALNAGVEAARAGEAGRGFAVVATEVRALAQRSSDAAKDISDIIQSSGRDVATGVDMIGQTQATLEAIVSGTAELSAMIDQIAQSSREQSAAIMQVDSVVGDMDRATQQNAALVEQSTAASRSLACEAETLAGLVERFDMAGYDFADDGDGLGRSRLAA